MLSQSQIRAAWHPPCRGPWVRVPANGAGSWVVRPAAAEAFKALATVQRAFGYVTRRDDTGAYVCRTNVSGTATSTHAYGIAGDSNWRCLAGETLVVTPDGPTPIAELAGTTARLLTRDPFNGGKARWVDAPVHSFGIAPVKRVTLSRRGVQRTIRATADHRWFVYENPNQARRLLRVAERTTDSLTAGASVLGCLPPSEAPRTLLSPVGIQAGLVFGDGSRDANRGSVVALYGEKMEMLRWFAEPRVAPLCTDNGVPGVLVSGLPGYFKDAPNVEESDSYLLGWLAGYFAADGSVGRGGAATITSARREHLELFRNVATRLGIACNDIGATKREGFGVVSEKFSLSLIASTVPESFYLRASHAERAAERAGGRKDRHAWKVESVVDDGECEVFCATVEGTGAFALDGWILTGNSNPYGQMRRTDRPAEMNRAVVAIRTNNGKQVFNWGGYWSGNKDPMHDEIVCAPRDLATGINWATVAGHAAPKPTLPPPSPLVLNELQKLVLDLMFCKAGTVRRGDQNKCVFFVQLGLQKAGAWIAVDNDFGPRTEAFVRWFQGQRGLVVDGVVGPATWNALWPA